MAQRNDCSLNKVMRVRRALRLSKDIFYADTLKNGTHSTTGNKTGTCCSRLEEYLSSSKSSLNFMRNSTLKNRNLYEILLSSLDTFRNGGCNLTSLTKSPADNTIAVTDYNNRSKSKGTTTLGNFSNTVNSNQSVF